MGENIAVFFALRGGCGGHVAVDKSAGSICGGVAVILLLFFSRQRFDGAVLKIGGGAAKDEIDIAADITAFVVVSAHRAGSHLLGT